MTIIEKQLRELPQVKEIIEIETTLTMKSFRIIFTPNASLEEMAMVVNFLRGEQSTLNCWAEDYLGEKGMVAIVSSKP